MIKKMFLAATVVLVLNSCVHAGDSFCRKAERHKQEFSEIALYIVSKGYTKYFANAYLYLQVDTIENARIKQFCKKFKINQITIQGKYDYQGKSGKFVEDSVIIFERKHTPLIGTSREIIVECSTEKKDYADFEGYGQKLTRIEKGMYCFRH